MARRDSGSSGRKARSRRTGERRSRKRDPERTKAKILDAATELFTQLGLNGTSLDDIAKRAGINRGLIYHYYKTKDFLFDQVLAKPLAAYVQSHLEFLQRKELDVTTLRDATEQFFWFLARRPELCRLLGWTLAMQRLSVDLAQLEFTRALYQRAIERIEQGQAAGLLRRDLDSKHLLITIIDLCVAWNLSRDEWTAKLDWTERDPHEVDEERLAAILDVIEAAARPRPASA
jgi:TetR/AcrR family transcriptional regulator